MIWLVAIIISLAENIVTTFEEKKIGQLCSNAIDDLKSNYDWNEISKRYIKIYKEIRND
jgi:glycosyltransferase involved in cell wall biosynthesis